MILSVKIEYPRSMGGAYLVTVAQEIAPQSFACTYGYISRVDPQNIHLIYRHGDPLSNQRAQEIFPELVRQGYEPLNAPAH